MSGDRGNLGEGSVATGSDAIAQIEQEEAAARARSGGSWFYWLAGLSVINSIILYAGGQWSFIFGLGMTQVVDAIVYAATEQSPDLRVTGIVIAVVVNLAIVGLFLLFGRYATRARIWAFVVGGLLYLGDAALVLWARDYLALAFHGWVLFQLWRGFQAASELQRS